MTIILVVTGAKGGNVVFVSDTLRAYSLDEAVRLARAEKFDNVYAVNGKNGAYLRTRPRVPKKEELEQLAVSPRQVSVVAAGLRNPPSTPPALNRYLQLYADSLREKGGPFITIGGKTAILKQAAKEQLHLHRRLIFEAGEKFTIDPYLLGAIIIDEIARFIPFEDIFEKLTAFFVNKNASGGIAQVKVETARGLIRAGYYNPELRDFKLSPTNVAKTSRAHLYGYVQDPKHSIFFAAAQMRALTNRWERFVDLRTRPEIIATLYHLPSKPPHSSPQPNERGLQIANEFYRLAKIWLQ